MALGILVFAIGLGAIGQILMKSGVNQLGAHPAPALVLRSIFTNLRIFGGFACYGISSLFYLVAISRLPLSYAYPMVALSYVLVTFLAWRLLHEEVPMIRVAGLALIMLGVIVMALSYRAAISPSVGDAKTIFAPAPSGPTP